MTLRGFLMRAFPSVFRSVVASKYGDKFKSHRSRSRAALCLNENPSFSGLIDNNTSMAQTISSFTTDSSRLRANYCETTDDHPTQHSGNSQDAVSNENKFPAKLTFVSHTNPVTGKVDWAVEDENYDYVQEIARSGYGDMLHDTDRNAKYYLAIRQAVKLLKSQNKQVKALDIGTGTGLLSMMASEAGADTVTACEAFPPMAECAAKVLEANGFKKNVKLIQKRSTEMSLADMGERANLLVTELFDTELIGEGAIGSYSDAHARLMQDDCVAVPTTGIMYVQAVHCELLKNWNSLQPIQLSNGKVLTVPDKYSRCGGAPSLHDLQVDELCDDLKLLSQPVEVFRFDFSKKNALPKKEQNQQMVSALQNGTVDAFVMWWDLIMDPQGEIVLSCSPCWSKKEGEVVPWRDHWMQALYYPSSPIAVKKGERFLISSYHDEYSLWFDTSKTDNERPVCTCGLHVAFSRSRLGQINDSSRNQLLIEVMEKHITPDTVCLAISDGTFLPLFAVSLGAKKVFYLDTNSFTCKIVKDLIDHNGLQDKVTILDKDIEELSQADLDFLKIDLVIAEPFFQAAHLPWEHLYFWYALNSFRPHLSTSVTILPKMMQVKAMGINFRDLQKIRAPVGNCEGFDISEFDKLIEKSSASADKEIEPQPLWEYPGVELSLPSTVATIDFSQFVDSVDRVDKKTTDLVFCCEGILNGVAFWTEFDFGDDHRISTGIKEEKVEGKKIGWDKFSRQGVKLFRQGKLVKKGSKLTVAWSFTPENGDFEFLVE